MLYSVCMIGPDIKMKGGIATIANEYLSSSLNKDKNIIYIPTVVDGNILKKLIAVIKAYIYCLYIFTFNKPDIVHIHSAFESSFYRKSVFILISKAFKLPVINHIHGSEFESFYFSAGKFKKTIIKYIYSKVDVTIVLSKQSESIIKQIIPNNKISIVENFAPKYRTVDDTDQTKTIAAKENIVLFLGHINERKGVYDIPFVIKSIVKRKKDVKFILAGNGDVDEVKSLCKQEGLIDIVQFPGWINKDEKQVLLNRCKVFFLPSYSEGMPMSILEAMSYGMPVVSTNVGGIPELVEDGINGYVYKPGSIKDFANAILKLLRDDKKYNYISQSNINKVKDKYSLEKNLQRINSIYDSLLKDVLKINKCKGEFKGDILCKF